MRQAPEVTQKSVISAALASVFYPAQMVISSVDEFRSVAHENEMLKEEKDLPDNPTAQLKEGQSAYTLETDLAKLGGTILPGQKVDIYASLTDRDGSPVSGCLIENARVIAVKDHNGLDLDDPGSTGTPYLTILAVMRKDLPYLSAAETAGSVRLIASGQTYDSDAKEAVLNENSELLNYLDGIMIHEKETVPVMEFPAASAE